MSDDDLDLIETDRLIDALFRRSVGLLLVMDARLKNSDRYECIFKFYGGIDEGLRLARKAEARFLEVKDEHDGGDPPHEETA
jgi:hypothetical protein